MNGHDHDGLSPCACEPAGAFFEPRSPSRPRLFTVATKFANGPRCGGYKLSPRSLRSYFSFFLLKPLDHRLFAVICPIAFLDRPSGRLRVRVSGQDITFDCCSGSRR